MNIYNVTGFCIFFIYFRHRRRHRMGLDPKTFESNTGPAQYCGLDLGLWL